MICVWRVQNDLNRPTLFLDKMFRIVVWFQLSVHSPYNISFELFRRVKIKTASGHENCFILKS